MCRICAHCPRVCSLKDGTTALMAAAYSSACPAIVEALLKMKANVEVTDEVRHWEDNLCATCVLIAHACVFAEVRHDSSDVRCGLVQIPGCRGGPVEREGKPGSNRQGEAFGGESVCRICDH